MSSYEPNKEHLRHAMLFLFNQKKSACECQRILSETYGEAAPTIPTCVRWFRRFKSGDFDVNDKERLGQPKKFEDAELQAVLDEDDTLTQKMMVEMLGVARQTISYRLRAMGKVQKLGKWVPHDLNNRQMEKKKTVCELLLVRYERKSFLHRIVTGDEKWIYFGEPKTQEIVGRSRTIVHIECTTESLRPQDNAVHLVGSTRRTLQGASETGRNGKCGALPSTTNQFKPCIDRKTTEMGQKTWSGNLAA